MINLDKIYKSIQEDIQDIFQQALKNVNLEDSNLYKELKVEVNDSSDIFKVLYNDYLEYIELGRKPKTKKVPINDLRDWAKRKNINTDNSILYAIQQSIYMKGIPARPILINVDKNIDMQWMNKWSDDIFQEIIKKINL